MKIKYFSIPESILLGISLYFSNIGIFLKIFLIGCIISLFYFFISLFSINDFYYIDYTFSFGHMIKCISVFNKGAISKSLLVAITFFIIYSFYEAGLIRLSLNIDEKKDKTNIKDFLCIDYSLASFLGSKIWYSIVVLFGLIFFIVPGILLYTRYYFAHFFVIDKKFSIEFAFRASSLLTWGFKFKILVFDILLKILLFVLVFQLPFDIFIMLGVAIPIAILIKSQIYLQLMRTSDLLVYPV